MEEEQLGEMIKILILAGHISKDEAIELIKSGTSRMLKQPIKKIFR